MNLLAIFLTVFSLIFVLAISIVIFTKYFRDDIDLFKWHKDNDCK